jgi:iron(III) transport system ATP-binding protein
VDGLASSPTTDDKDHSGLVISGLHKSYAARHVLKGVDLVVPEGTITAVLGPSGCGKTTLLRIIAGFTALDAGSVVLDGTVLDGAGRAVPPERRHVGIVPQEGALFPHLSVADNIGFGLQRTHARRSTVSKWLDRLGLAGRESARPHELSGGQQQRVALARALAAEPKLVLLDEPFSSLDAALRGRVREEIASVLRENRVTALLVTHDQQEALSISDRVAVMHDGRIAQAGTPTEVYRLPVSMAVAEFVGDINVIPGVLRDGYALTALGCHDVVGNSTSSGRITCRPEQVSVRVPGDRATVVEAKFFGADTVLRLRLDDGTFIVARSPPDVLPKIGTRADVSIDGPVLVLE